MRASSVEPLSIVLVPGLLASPRVFFDQLGVLCRLGPVTLADTRRGASLPEIAARILAAAPPRFALVGHSLGGYIAFEMLRRARERVSHLALLDTSARSDSATQTKQRLGSIQLARRDRLGELADLAFPRTVHRARWHDEALRQALRRMAVETPVDVFVRQQQAALGRPDSRPDLASIRCPTLVLVGDSDEITPLEHSSEIANGVDGAELVVIPRAGHATTLETPELVNQALWRTLTTASPGARSTQRTACARP